MPLVEKLVEADRLLREAALDLEAMGDITVKPSR